MGTVSNKLEEQSEGTMAAVFFQIDKIDEEPQVFRNEQNRHHMPIDLHLCPRSTRPFTPSDLFAALRFTDGAQLACHSALCFPRGLVMLFG